MSKKARLTFFQSGLTLILLLTACNVIAGNNDPLPAVTEPASVPTNEPPAQTVSPLDSLPPVCNCTLRFDLINIEQGLSQSSVRVIFQDHLGFLWFGTEDGLNRYDGHTFKVYKPDPDTIDSLSDRWITSIVEDRDGKLWVGTRLGGLNHFDPQSGKFTRYQFDPQDPASLSDNHINALLVDKDGTLWVGTTKGLDRFDPETNSFTRYQHNADQPKSLSGTIVTAIYQDGRGHYWVGTADAGLNSFDAKSGEFASFQSNADDPRTLSNNHVTAIEEDANGTLWVGTTGGLNQLSPSANIFTRYMESDDPLDLADDMVYSLLTDRTGNLWIGTANGLDRMNKSGSYFIHYYNDPAFAGSLSNNTILSIFEDRGGVLWFGTYGSGVNKYDRERDRFAYYRHDPKNPNSLSGNFIFPIFVDQEGSAWIGTYGDGLNRFIWPTGQIVRYRHNPKDPNSIGSDELISIFEDKQGILWIGTTNGLDRFDRMSRIFQHYRRDTSDPNSIGSNIVYAIYEDSRGQLWVGTYAGLDRLDRETGVFTHYRPNPGDPNGLSGNQVYTIYEDRQGRLWIGTFESGLNRYDRAADKFTRYRFDQKNKQSLSNDSILSIYQDTQDRLWIGTGGGGLNLYHPETDSFTYYLEKDGLSNGVVYGMLEDEQGYLWLSTNFGIARFDPQTGTFRNFDRGDGLQSNEFNSNAYAKGQNGEFYFGGVNGLTVFRPSGIRDNPYLPQVVLTSLAQDSKSLVPDSSVETLQAMALRWPQNSFEFEFATLSYNQPAKNQYAYMLENFDSDWNYIGTKRDGRYTNLPGGTYALLLKGSNSDGVWNEQPLRIHMTVVPPFWQRLWIRALMVIVLIFAIAGGYGLRVRGVQKRNRELEHVVQERTRALEKRGQEMEALYQADEKILRNVSLNQVFQTLVDVSVDMLHADRSVVFAWDEEQTRVVPRVSHGFAPKTLKVMRFAKGEGIVGQVLATGQAVIAPELNPDDLRPDVREAILDEGIQSFVHLPITVDNKVVAVFNVGFTSPGALNEDIVRLFTALVQRASLSIANMELFEQTKDLAVMEERNRLARDLHDSAKQKAFAALAQLGTVKGILKTDGASANPHLIEAENLVYEVIQELTFLIQEIYPIALQDKGLIIALREYIFEWENRNDIVVNLAVRNERRLPLEVEQAIYRVIQEALANVSRHSRARRAEISLVYHADSLQVSLADNGCGFDVNQKARGMGLRSIRERLGSIHGSIQIQSMPGHGTRLFVQVPIKG